MRLVESYLLFLTHPVEIFHFHPLFAITSGLGTLAFIAAVSYGLLRLTAD